MTPKGKDQLNNRIDGDVCLIKDFEVNKKLVTIPVINVPVRFKELETELCASLTKLYDAYGKQASHLNKNINKYATELYNHTGAGSNKVAHNSVENLSNSKTNQEISQISSSDLSQLSYN